MNNQRNIVDSVQEEFDKKIEKYKGKKVSELKEIFGMQNKDNKASFVQLALQMLGTRNNQITLSNGQVKGVLKTVRLTGLEEPAEATSFMPVKFDEWLNCTSWNTCSLYKYFNEKTLIWFVFQQYPSGKRVADSEMIFRGVKVWKMSEYDLNHGLKEIWEEVCSLIKNNKVEIISKKQNNGRIINKNNLPGSKFNELGHLRPGGVNGNDKVVLPTGQSIAKQRFWFNSLYVKEILSE